MDKGALKVAADTPGARELLDALLKQAKDHAVLVFGTDQRILWASNGAELILGQPREKLIGLCTAELFLDEDVERLVPEHEFEIARSRSSAEDDRWSKRPDGSLFWASGVAYALRDDQGELIGYGKIIQNRTDWKLRHDTIANQLRAMAGAVEQKNLLISTLAHELRNPLAPLINAAGLLREGMPGDYPIKLIERQVDFITRLVDDLLDATRVSAGKLQLKRERLVLQDVIAASVETVRPLTNQRGHRLELLLAPASIHVDAYGVRLQQVFSNLLTNSAKFTPDGGTIWVKAMTEDTEAVVRIEDNGIGIEPDMLLYIFDLFAQVQSPKGIAAGNEPGSASATSASGNNAAGGLGIGLSLVKELVALHGGTVQANSDGIGKGSAFTIRLPCVEGDNAKSRPAVEHDPD